MSNKKNIVIPILATFKGFWLSIAKQLASEFNIIIVLVHASDKKRCAHLFTEFDVHIEIKDDFFSKKDFSYVDVFKEARLREERYGETFSMIISQDRLLGRGHLFCAVKLPDVYPALWTYERKIKSILDEFCFWEYIVDKYSPFMILSALDYIKALALITRYNKIEYLSIFKAKIGSRYIWVENEYMYNNKLVEFIKKNVKKFMEAETFSPVEYVMDQPSILELTKHPYGFMSMVLLVITYSYNEFERLIYITYKKKIRNVEINAIYKYWAWLPIQIRRFFRYRYFLRHGKNPDELKCDKIVFFALHQEPEITLQTQSPEFNNSLEIIGIIAKSLKANTLLVVREHPLSFGIRSKDFHDCLRKMGNVILAHPEVSCWEWIKKADLVVTISGTVGVEAVFFGKPVVTFGKYQMIRNLPTVKYVSNYDMARKTINELLCIPIDDKIYEVSKQALYHAQMEMSFDMPKLEEVNKNLDFQLDNARAAVRNLKEHYLD